MRARLPQGTWLVASLLLVAAAATAYVRSRTSLSNQALAWTGNCAYVTPDIAGTPDIPLDSLLAELQRSADTWTSVPCSYFQLIVDPAEAVGPAMLEQPTGVNSVVFRRDSWCPPDPEEPCYDASATALTTIFYLDKPGDSEDGRILGADLEMNNIGFAFTVDGTRPPGTNNRPLADVQNTVTHELGHLLGLDHPCYDGWNPCEDGWCKEIAIACQTEDDCIPRDDHGDPIPRCSGSLPEEITAATMYNYATAGDTDKRSLEQDDIDGICGIYPLAEDPGHCSRVDTTGKVSCCAVAGTGSSPTASLAFLGFLLLVLGRRSPRKDHAR